MGPNIATVAVIALLAVAPWAAVTPARAQGTRGVVLPTSELSDRTRLLGLAGDTTGPDPMLRSPSEWLRRGDTALTAPRLVGLLPDLATVVNSAIPYSMNDGALWAGRGVNVRVIGGAELLTSRVRLVLAPELDVSSNARFDYTRPLYRYVPPPVPVTRYGNGFANPWYARPYSADLPWRFGSDPFARFTLGQSGAWVTLGGLEAGATTENAWWGPGVRNAIILSDNAAGIPRLELRDVRPWRTRAGVVEWRWFVGALSESAYFDTTQANDVRSLAAAAVTWRPWFQPSLTVGAARAVYGTAPGYAAVAGRWLDVFRDTGHPADYPPSDSSLTPGGRDQLISLFARWVFPADGFEAYTEWARQELPRSLHDFLIAPTQSHGYTLGLQWRESVPRQRPAFRVQAEITTLEQSPTFKTRPVGVFYTSRRVIQGYTELGEPIGAAIGPGASSQWLALDRVGPTASLGITLSRIRWNEDVRSTHTWPEFLGYCNHDVSVLPGLRGGHTVGGGYLSGELIVGTRMNLFFQNTSGCQGPAQFDARNTTVSLTFSPFHR